jgi:hypothetical protein
MAQLNLQINFNPKVVVAALLAIGAIALVPKIPETKAQASSAITGKYGCIMNTNPLPYLTQKTNTYAFINQISMMDFDARTINSSISNALAFNTAGTTNQNDEVSGAFTIASGPFSGAFTISPALGGSYIVVPVNSANTLLIKSREEGNQIPETGVCQKI